MATSENRAFRRRVEMTARKSLKRRGLIPRTKKGRRQVRDAVLKRVQEMAAEPQVEPETEE